MQMDKKTKKHSERERESKTLYVAHNTFCFKRRVSLLRPLLRLAVVVEYIEVRR